MAEVNKKIVSEEHFELIVTRAEAEALNSLMRHLADLEDTGLYELSDKLEDILDMNYNELSKIDDMIEIHLRNGLSRD